MFDQELKTISQKIAKQCLEKDIFILNETGHFPFFEDPGQLESILSKALISNAS